MAPVHLCAQLMASLPGPSSVVAHAKRKMGSVGVKQFKPKKSAKHAALAATHGLARRRVHAIYNRRKCVCVRVHAHTRCMHALQAASDLLYLVRLDEVQISIELPRPSPIVPTSRLTEVLLCTSTAPNY